MTKPGGSCDPPGRDERPTCVGYLPLLLPLPGWPTGDATTPLMSARWRLPLVARALRVARLCSTAATLLATVRLPALSAATYALQDVDDLLPKADETLLGSGIHCPFEESERRDCLSSKSR